MGCGYKCMNDRDIVIREYTNKVWEYLVRGMS